jgi:hypothetical protein
MFAVQGPVLTAQLNGAVNSCKDQQNMQISSKKREEHNFSCQKQTCVNFFSQVFRQVC